MIHAPTLETQNNHEDTIIDGKDASVPAPPIHSTTSIPLNEPLNDQPAKTRWARWSPHLKLGAAVAMPCILEILDYTIVATSQPNIASIFNRLNLQSYIGTSYVLGSTVFLPIFASVADVFGRYWVMQASVFLFLIGSVLCTCARNMEMLLVGRGVSGIGAAGLLTLVRIILSDSMSLDDNNVQGLILLVIYTSGYTAGPLLGGELLRINWRWIFAINIPICILSMIIMHFLLPSIIKGPQPAQRLKRLPIEVANELQARDASTSSLVAALRRLDIVGATTFVILGILVLLGLNWGSTQSWNQPKVIACLVTGGALVPSFIVWEYIVDHSTDHLVLDPPIRHSIDLEASGSATFQWTPEPMPNSRTLIALLTPRFTYLTDPMIPMNMFRSYDMIATAFASLTSGVFYFVAIFYVIVGGHDAVNAGVQLLYFAPGMGIGTMIANRMIHYLRQPRWAIIAASTILPIGTGLLAQSLYTGKEAQIRGFMILGGAGVGMGFGPPTFQARFSQPEDRVAIVVATNLFFRALGGTFGLAQLSAVMNSRVRSYISRQNLSGRLSSYDAARIQATLSGSTNGILGLPDDLRVMTVDAFRDGLRWAFFSLVPWLIIAWILVLFLRPVNPARLGSKVARSMKGIDLTPKDAI